MPLSFAPTLQELADVKIFFSHDLGRHWLSSHVGLQECQEKEGLFMMAFPSPVTALEWALTLQLALTKYASASLAQAIVQYGFAACCWLGECKAVRPNSCDVQHASAIVAFSQSVARSCFLSCPHACKSHRSDPLRLPGPQQPSPATSLSGCLCSVAQTPTAAYCLLYCPDPFSWTERMVLC